MWQWLLNLDQQLFYLINKTLANPVFDIIMPFITTEEHFIVPVFLLWLALLFFGGKRGRTAAVLILFAILLSDQLSSSVFKPLIGRIRPCNALPDVRLLDRCSGSFSFPSSHATNIFTASYLFAKIYPRIKVYLFAFAVMVAYSRPYVGVHYPADVIGGAILGILCGMFILMLYRAVAARAPQNWALPQFERRCHRARTAAGSPGCLICFLGRRK